MEIAIFGGSFNPVHNGHIAFCRQCAGMSAFDRVLLMPANVPPHKAALELASNADRIEMLRLAAAGEPDFSVSDLEYRLGGRSYTVETLRALHRERPGDRFTLLLGSDMFRTFRQWYRCEEILELASLLAGARHPGEYEELSALRESFGEKKSRIRVADIRVTEVSSTQVREKIRRGEDVSGLLPPAVYAYILSRGLYRGQSG